MSVYTVHTLYLDMTRHKFTMIQKKSQMYLINAFFISREKKKNAAETLLNFIISLAYISLAAEKDKL